MARLKIVVLIFLWAMLVQANAQNASITGRVTALGKPIEAATVQLSNGSKMISDSIGGFSFTKLNAGTYVLGVQSIGYNHQHKRITVKEGEHIAVTIEMGALPANLDDVVVTGTLKEVNRMESPVPVEVYTPTFLKKNPTPNIFDALQNVNGVRPQLNCNVCNTGDIHMNGLEGPYTMVLIDGMPIVSSLSTVYGLSGIPNSLVERIEIVKGPASSLYGSEAVGGLINIITKKPNNAPQFSADVFTTSWKELNADIGFTYKLSKRIKALAGINYFKYDNIIDNNQDGFTDVTLQDRISIFQKWSIERKSNRVLNIAARYFTEDRWGGETNWNKSFRGGDSIYGESIYTNRWELLGNYQLPVKEKIMFSFSYNSHSQDSRYGVVPYIAQQHIVFSQLTWDKTIKQHNLLIGAAFRYTIYDDNSPATYSFINATNAPQKTNLPGIFLQDEIKINQQHKFLLGFRYDYNSVHGNIYTPRLAYKWSINKNNLLRLNAGTGYRVVNLFTEDHAALTGARNVEIKNELQPERTYNININYLKKITSKNGTHTTIDITAWYTYFNNRIIGDYDTDPNKIIYDNLKGHAVSRGISANVDIALLNGVKVLAGATYQDVFTSNNGVQERQILTEKWSGTWAISYKLKKAKLAVDYTGNVYGSMRLPLLSALDPRQAYSPVWSIQNIQLVYSGLRKVEIYGGVKNLLNWTPNEGNPFIIARTNDPFDKQVKYDANGQVLASANNPYALTFDPNYVYAPNQGRRLFIGLRINLR